MIVPLALLAALSLAVHARLAHAHHVPWAAAVTWAAGLVTVGGQVILSWCVRPYTCAPPPGKVAVIVPCYNEDAGLLGRVLLSLAVQSRRADQVIVVDDGSTVDYAQVRADWPGVTWIRQDNAGKKHAHAAGFAAAPDADYFCTIDSDSALEYRALENGLRPFADPRVTCVAGLEWAGNYAHNLLTRMQASRVLAFELFAMSSQSAAGGQVLIAPGAFSLFRAPVIREVVGAYTHETLCGMPVRLGDDTMLTFMCLMAGRVVQQPTAVAFPAYPEKLSHHLRQWMRWMRASSIRQIWRIRYLPMTSFGWWVSVWQLGAFTAGVAASVLLIVAWPDSKPLLLATAAGLAGWPMIVGLRLFCVRRSDQSIGGLLYGLALMPLGALWYLLVLRQLRFIGIATIASQGWVTRKKVEVTLRGPARAA